MADMADNDEAQQVGMVNNLYEIIPKTFKDLRACLRCSLIKEYEKFYENGCENCTFMAMQENAQRVMECTTSYFEGTIALIEPDSWVGKWQKIGNFEPGMYAVEVVGTLPEDVIEYCENLDNSTKN